MKRRCIFLVCLLAWVSALIPAPAQVASRLTYTLLEGSYFVDDCLICERPTIQLPMRGTFDLVLQQNTPPYTQYAIRNLDFTAGVGTSLQKRITGDGTYTRFEEFAILQDMTLATQVRNTWTNRAAYFTNNARMVQQPFPLIQADLTETNGTLLQTFSTKQPGRQWAALGMGQRGGCLSSRDRSELQRPVDALHRSSA